MRMTEEEFASLERRRKGHQKGAVVHTPSRSAAVSSTPEKGNGETPAPGQRKTPPRAKYGNTKVVVDGHKFDSKKEAERYLVLKDDQAAGRIRNLLIQPVFVLAPSVVLQGKKKPSLRYYADFSYEAGNGGGWVAVVEDVKSEATKANALYRAKLHLLKWVHDIDVEEV